MSMDVVKLLKTQDAGYIRTMLQVVRKERKRLEEEVVLEEEEVKGLGDRDEVGNKGKHTVFVGDKGEQNEFKADEWFGTGKDFVGRVWNRPRRESNDDKKHAAEENEEKEQPKKLSKKQQEAKLLAEKEERWMRSKRQRTQERRAAHLEAVKKREQDLMAAEEELENQRAKMSGSIGGVNKNGVKFKIRERKR